jgi:hypothetical protein
MNWKKLALLTVVGGVAGIAYWAWAEHERMLDEKREKDYWDGLDVDVCGEREGEK